MGLRTAREAACCLQVGLQALPLRERDLFLAAASREALLPESSEPLVRVAAHGLQHIVWKTKASVLYLYPAIRGAGRFEKIGFPNTEFWGYFVGIFETVCGGLILLGSLFLILVGGSPYSLDALLARRSHAAASSR